MQDIIALLLQKRAELEREYAEKEQRIDALLEMAGYTPPVAETVTDPDPVDAPVRPVPSVDPLMY